MKTLVADPRGRGAPTKESVRGTDAGGGLRRGSRSEVTASRMHTFQRQMKSQKCTFGLLTMAMDKAAARIPLDTAAMVAAEPLGAAAPCRLAAPSASGGAVQ